jgi:hypothetical protein
MCMYVYSMFVLSCVGRCLALSWSLIQGVLPYVYKRLRNQNRRPGPGKGCRATEKKTVLVDRGRFFSFLIYTKLVELLGQEIIPSQSRYLDIEQDRHRINADQHPCLEWDWTHEPSVSAIEDSSLLRPRGYCHMPRVCVQNLNWIQMEENIELVDASSQIAISS